MAVLLSPVGGVAGQFFDNNGAPLSGGKMYTYVAGTTTPQATYTSASGATAHSNPIVLDSGGRVPGGEIWLTDGLQYKFVLNTSTNVLIGTYDNVNGIPNSNALVSFEATLAGSTGSSLVGYQPVGTGAVATTVQGKLRESVSVKDFGAVGDGVADDTVPIQLAINYCFTNGKNLTAPVGATYKISSTLSIPQYFNYDLRAIKIDFCGAKFKLTSDITLFKSTSWGTTLDSIISFGIDFGNFTIIVPTAGTIVTSVSILIQDWHQNCFLHNITAMDVATVVHSNNSYYCNFDNILTTMSTGVKAGDRFIFSGAHNLNKLSHLQAADAVIGYRFDGAVTALQMTNISFEGQERGVRFNSYVYDGVIENSYMEGVTDVVVTTENYVFGLTLKNNYVNFLSNPTMYLLAYFPNPNNNIHICDDNCFEAMPSVSNIIKYKEDVYGSGITIDRFSTNVPDTSTLIVDSTKIGANVKWNQKASSATINAAVVNGYAVGNYAGSYTNGLYGGLNGFDWVNTGNNTLVLRTKIKNNFAQLVYVAIEVAHSAGPTTIKGQFVGTAFYEYTAAGLVLSTKLQYGTYGGFIEIDGGISFNTTVTGCIGEVRLI